MANEQEVWERRADLKDVGLDKFLLAKGCCARLGEEDRSSPEARNSRGRSRLCAAQEAKGACNGQWGKAPFPDCIRDFFCWVLAEYLSEIPHSPGFERIKTGCRVNFPIGTILLAVWSGTACPVLLFGRAELKR